MHAVPHLFMSVFFKYIFKREERMIYHVTQAYTEYEYYRVEADSADEAEAMVNTGDIEPYNWDRTYESSEVEPCVEGCS